MKIALLYTSNPARRIALNKDLNGGLGTADDYGPSLSGRVLSWLKWKLIAMPVVSMAYLQAVLRAQGHEVTYHEDETPAADFDLGLMYGSLVDRAHENAVVAALKKSRPGARVGFFGPYPARFPESFSAGDFTLGGEAEAFFLERDAAELREARGLVPGGPVEDLDALPAPDFAGFPIGRYRYAPMLPRRPYLPLLASRGCPFPCGFYCAYASYQGASYRQRSAARVHADMAHVRRAYGARSVQFRDATFGLDRRFVEELCGRLEKEPTGLEWGIETRADLLDADLLARLARAGLRSLNLGVETRDAAVAKANQRPLVEDGQQRGVVRAAQRLGVRVNAFFMLGLEGDTVAGIRDAGRYARELAPDTARFCVSTPYPGTPFHAKLAAEGRLEQGEEERYTQFALTFRHPRMSAGEVQRELVAAYRRFYLRPGPMADAAGSLLSGAW